MTAVLSEGTAVPFLVSAVRSGGDAVAGRGPVEYGSPQWSRDFTSRGKHSTGEGGLIVDRGWRRKKRSRGRAPAAPFLRAAPALRFCLRRMYFHQQAVTRYPLLAGASAPEATRQRCRRPHTTGIFSTTDRTSSLLRRRAPKPHPSHSHFFNHEKGKRRETSLLEYAPHSTGKRVQS
jgi:hypothetical protein